MTTTNKETHTNKTFTPKMPEFNVRTREIVKFSQLNGKALIGTVTGKRERELTDSETGELKTIKDLCMNNYPDGTRIAVAIDAGLRVALSTSDVQNGELIKITKGEPMDLGNGKKVNQYNIEIANKH